MVGLVGWSATAMEMAAVAAVMVTVAAVAWVAWMTWVRWGHAPLLKLIECHGEVLDGVGGDDAGRVVRYDGL